MSYGFDELLSIEDKKLYSLEEAANMMAIPKLGRNNLKKALAALNYITPAGLPLPNMIDEGYMAFKRLNIVEREKIVKTNYLKVFITGSGINFLKQAILDQRPNDVQQINDDEEQAPWM